MNKITSAFMIIGLLGAPLTAYAQSEMLAQTGQKKCTQLEMLAGLDPSECGTLPLHEVVKMKTDNDT